MKTIKESQLKELFEKFGLSEGLFDIFKKKTKGKVSKSTKKKLAAIDSDIEDVINSAPTDEEREALRDAANTNLSKFMKNVESRIYAQLSKQLVDNMFGEGSENEGTVTFEGTTISYAKSTDNVTLTIMDANASETVITVPIGDFTF